MSATESPTLLQTPMRRAVWILAFPTIVLGLVRSGYFLANSYWVADLGREALAAIGGAAFAVWTVYSLAEIAAMGVYSQVAQAIGARDKARACRAMGHGLVLSIIVGLVIGLGLYLARGVYYDLIGETDHTVRALGMSFLGLTALGVPSSIAFFTLVAAFRGVGDAATPTRIYVVTLLINALIDPFLIYGLGEWEGWGVSGAAVATIVAEAVGVVLSWRLLLLKGYRPRIGKFIPGWLLRIAAIGTPIAASGAGFSLVYVFLGREVNRFGPAAMAAMGVSHRIESIGYLTCIGFQVAATSLVGQWVGARDREQAAKAARTIRCEMLRVLIPMSLVAFALGPYFLRVFTDDPEILAHGAVYLRINGPLLWLMGLEVVYEGAFSGAGRTLPAFVISFPLTAARIPLSYYLGVVLGMGASGIWTAIALTTALKGVIFTYWFARGHWYREEQLLSGSDA